MLVRWMLFTCMLLLKIEINYYVPRLPCTSNWAAYRIFCGFWWVGMERGKVGERAINYEGMLILSLYFRHIHAAVGRTE